ncbi:MAG TPA: hypothetical protein VGW38_00850, partial [Chloroflexota bacterium]|nr:hypothetical protein [Chloroflexota bacterium]
CSCMISGRQPGWHTASVVVELSELKSRKRRRSVARPRYGDGYIITAEALPVERVGRSKRAKPAKPRASIDELTRERIRQLAADGWSLGKIAQDVGVSHESVRKVLRSNPADVMAAD